MLYQTVFEVTQKPYEWWSLAYGLIFVFVGAALIKFGPKLDRHKNRKKAGLTFAVDPRILGWFFVISGSGWTLFVFSGTYSAYRQY
jgi:hypothetical protein